MASWPIFACRSLTLGPSVPRFSAAVANTSPAFSSSCAFHCVICCGWTSKRSASCASVWSPLTAASATFAFKVDEWLRRGRFIAPAPLRAYRPIKAESHLSHCLKKRSPLFYDLLKDSVRVFVDTKSLRYGDDWDVKLAEAQSSAYMTVVLVSEAVKEAYYLRS